VGSAVLFLCHLAVREKDSSAGTDEQKMSFETNSMWSQYSQKDSTVYSE